jgi:hypothetical protein
MLILAWKGFHAETGLAKELGVLYIDDTTPLAEAYLFSHGWEGEPSITEVGFFTVAPCTLLSGR